MPNALDMMDGGPPRSGNALDALADTTRRPVPFVGGAPSESTAPLPPGAKAPHDAIDEAMRKALTWTGTAAGAVGAALQVPANVARWSVTHPTAWMLPQPDRGLLPRIAAGVEPGSNFRAVLPQLPQNLPVPMPGNPGFTAPSGVAVEGLNAATDPLTYVTGGAGGLSRAGRLARDTETAAAIARMNAVTLALKADATAGEAAVQAVRATRAAQGARAAIAAGGERTLLEIGGQNIIPADKLHAEASKIVAKALETGPGKALAEGVQKAFVTARQGAPAPLAAKAVVAGSSGAVAADRAMRDFKPLAREVVDIARQHGIPEDKAFGAVMEAQVYSKAKQFDNPVDWLTWDEREKLLGDADPLVKAELEAAGRFRAESAITRSLNFREISEYGRLSRGLTGPQDAARLAALRATAQQRANAAAIADGLSRAQSTFGLPPASMNALEPAMREWIATMNVRNAMILNDTRAAGVPLSGLVDDVAYARYAMTPEAKDAARAWGKLQGGDLARDASSMTAREFTEKHAPQLMREFRGMSPNQINELAQAGKLRVLGYKPVQEMFYSNPFIAQVIRESEGAKAIGSADLFRSALVEYGKPVGDLSNAAARAEKIALEQQGWRVVPNQIDGIGDKVLFPPKVADLLQSHLAAVREPGAFLGALNRTTQVWKSYTLGINTGYHVRNFIGDLWNAVVLGGANPAHARDAADIVAHRSDMVSRALRIDRQRTATVGNTTLTLEGWHDLMSTHGALGNNLSLADFDRGILEGAGAQSLGGARKGVRAAFKTDGVTGAAREVNRALTDNGFVRTALAAGNMREGFTRAMAFLSRIEKGDTPELAAAFVRQHLFDYGDLTDTERAVRGTLIPFYTWTRKNIPLQMSYLFTKPGRYSALEYGRHAMANVYNEGRLEHENAPLQSYLRNGVPVPIGRNPQGVPEYLRLMGMLPAADLASFSSPRAAAGWLFDSINPVATAPIEALTGIDIGASTQNYRETGRVEPQRLGRGQPFSSVLGVPVPSAATPFTDLITPVQMLNRLNPGGVFGNEQGGPFGVSRPYADPSEHLRWMSYWLGIRPYTSDPAQQEEKRNTDTNKRAGELRRLLSSAQKKNDVVNIKALEAELARLERERSQP